MKRSKTLGIVGASAALVIGAAIGGPAAVAAASGSDAKITAPAGTDSIVVGAPVAVEPGANGIASVVCGLKVTGGGGQTSSFDIFFTDSFPADKKTWTVRGTNTGDTTQWIWATAVCK